MADYQQFWSAMRKSFEALLSEAEVQLVKAAGSPAPKAPTNGKGHPHSLTQSLAKGAARREKLLALQGSVDSLRKRYMRRG